MKFLGLAPLISDTPFAATVGSSTTVKLHLTKHLTIYTPTILEVIDHTCTFVSGRWGLDFCIPCRNSMNSLVHFEFAYSSH